MRVLFLICLSALTGCGGIDRIYTEVTGDLTYKCSEHGVEYIQSDSGLAVSLDKRGKPIACKE